MRHQCHQSLVWNTMSVCLLDDIDPSATLGDSSLLEDVVRLRSTRERRDLLLLIGVKVETWTSIASEDEGFACVGRLGVGGSGRLHSPIFWRRKVLRRTRENFPKACQGWEKSCPETVRRSILTWEPIREFTSCLLISAGCRLISWFSNCCKCKSPNR